MKVISLYKNSFIKKVIQASEALDTLVYLNAPSFEKAIEHWILDLANDIKDVIKKYERLEHEVISDAVIDINERILEKKNASYLKYLTDFREEVDYILARKSLQYVTICNKRDKTKRKSNIFKNKIIYQESVHYLNQLDVALKLINNFSTAHLNKCKNKHLNNLAKYQDLFSRLRLFEKLTRSQFIKSLMDKGDI